MMRKDYTNIQGASEELGCSKSTIYKWIVRKELKFSHRGKNNELIFSIKELHKFIKR
tara:strand:- start:918 stop:1088 length:171 start_codon:yes stop_codon:yes gene_type:complete